MADTQEPGDTVSRDGTVECTQYPGTRDKVKKGTTFAHQAPAPPSLPSASQGEPGR